MKKVSIVLPSYNGEQYIEQAIQSVLEQSYLNWELIIVDDCSTDGTASIINHYAQKDYRIQVIHNTENQRLPQSLNIGFRRATGDYFTWTSDDNYYDPDAIEVMVSFLEENPQYGLVYCDMNDLYEDGTLMRSNRVRSTQHFYSGSYFGACFLYRRQAAEAAGEYDPDMFLAEDYDFFLRLEKQAKLYYLPECKYTYRIHRESLSQTKTRQVWEQLWKLRRRELNYLLKKIDPAEKVFLFFEMWACRRDETWALRNIFFPDGELPRQIVCLKDRTDAIVYQRNRKPLILFGAGEHGRRALNYFGRKRIYCFADNNPKLTGTLLEDIPILSFVQMKEIRTDYEIVLTVGSRFLPEIITQMEDSGITNYSWFFSTWMNSEGLETQ